MGKSVEVHGLPEAMRGLTELDKQVEYAVKLATSRIAAAAEAEIKKQITGHHKAGTPTPSAVGSPPTNITGTLRASITSQTERVGFAEFYARIGPTTVYGRAVELGAPNWETGVAYPFVAPAFKKMDQSGTARAIYVNTVNSILTR